MLLRLWLLSPIAALASTGVAMICFYFMGWPFWPQSWGDAWDYFLGVQLPLVVAIPLAYLPAFHQCMKAIAGRRRWFSLLAAGCVTSLFPAALWIAFGQGEGHSFRQSVREIFGEMMIRAFPLFAVAGIVLAIGYSLLAPRRTFLDGSA